MTLSQNMAISAVLLPIKFRSYFKKNGGSYPLNPENPLTYAADPRKRQKLRNNSET